MRTARLLLMMPVAALLPAGCSTPPPPRPPTTLVVATGPAGGVYQPLGEALARLYNERVPGVQATARVTPGSVFNVDAIQKGDADVAFTQGDAAYSAFRQGTPRDKRPHSALRAIAVLYTNAMQIVARADSPVRTVTELRGRRVGVGPEGSGAEQAASNVMAAHGLTPADYRAEFLSIDEASARLSAGTLDADFVMASYPVPGIRSANDAVGIRLLDVDLSVIPRIRERYPFYRPLIVPRGTYTGQERDVRTLGVDNLLVCRAGLEEDLVRRLTQVLLDSLPELAQVHVAASGIDPEQAPAAVIPLHPGAARFYRERELLR